MRFLLNRQLGLALGLLLASTQSIADDCQRVFRMGWSPIWVTVEQQELRWLVHVFEKAHCTLQLSDNGGATFSRMLHELEQGDRDVVLGASFNSDRAKYLYFSPVYSVDEAVLLVRRDQLDRWKNKDLDQLLINGANLLLPKHGWYGEAFEFFRTHNAKHSQVFYYRHDRDAINDFFRSSADAVLTTTRVLDSLSDKQWQSELSVQSAALYQDNLHIVFSKRSMLYEDVQHINKVMSELIATGDTAKNFNPH